MSDPYAFQWDAVEQVLVALQEHRSVLLQAPTGAGKTRMATEIARLCDPPVLFIAERREIIRQSIAAFSGQGLDVDALTAESRTGNAVFAGFESEFVIASQRTAWSRGVRKGHKLGEFRTIITDECHHARAKTYEDLRKLWPDAVHVGLTATPVRGDGKGLGKEYAAMVQGADYGGNYGDLIAAGVLVPCPAERVWSWPQSLAGVRTQAGDWAMGGEKGAARVMDTPKLVGDIVQHWRELAEGRPTIVFATSVAHAEHLETAFEGVGIRAATVHAGTDKAERDRILAALGSDIQVAANYGVLTEGFDCPPVSCIVLARPTKQLGLYLQMVGRGLRASPGKTDLMLLDHAGVVPLHGLPGTDIRWELTTDNQAASVSGRKPRPCPQCRAILTRGKCNACGWQPEARPRTNGESAAGDYDADDHDTRVNLIRMSDERAAEIRAERASPEKVEYHRLLGRARKCGWDERWAARRFKDRFGKWPPFEWSLPNPASVEPAEFLAAARAFAAKKGWKPGWAAHQFRSAYGRFPPRGGR